MSVRKVTRGYLVPARQADALLNQASPTSGNAYTVLATTKNCRILSMYAHVEWTVQPTPLEIHLTIDGQTITYAVANPVSLTPYYARMNESAAPIAQPLDTNQFAYNRPFLEEGRSVKVQAEITGGTVQTLYAQVKYAKW